MNNKTRMAKAIDSQFRHLGQEAQYIQPNTPPISVQVLARRPEQLFEFGDARMHGENAQMEFRVSEVRSPNRGDEIHIDGHIYRIEAEPQRDLHQLVWVAPTLPIHDAPMDPSE